MQSSTPIFPWRRVFVPAIWLALFFTSFALHAQSLAVAQHSAAVSLREVSAGKVAIQIETSGFAQSSASTLFVQLPRLLSCRWTGRELGPNSIDGICRLDGSMSLTPLASFLHRHGEEAVTFKVATSGRDAAKFPRGWKSREAGKVYFISDRNDVVVPALPVQPGPQISPSYICVPLAVVLLIPALIAWAIRLRATRSSSQLNRLACMSWLNLGVWLYWITAITPNELAEYLIRCGSDGYVFTFATATLTFLAPPLTSIAIVVAVLARLNAASQGTLTEAVKRSLLAESVIMVPFAIFLIGMGLSSAGLGIATLALVLAYVAFRVLLWFQWSRTYSALKPLESGELFNRTFALAKRAGIKLTRLSLLQTRDPQEANAFATSGGAIVLTEGLVRTLSSRELDSVIAHELGHHKAGHLKFDASRMLFWGYLMAGEPAFAWTVAKLHAPHWLLILPIAPLLFMLLQGYVSQRREFEADTLGVELTGDPEGALMAMTRIAMLTHLPIQASSMCGAILTHPSIERRGLALAQRFGINKIDALALLRLPSDCPHDMKMSLVSTGIPSDEIFPLRARVLLSEQLRWMRLLAPVAGGALVASVLRYVPGVVPRVTLMAGAFVVLAFTLCAESLWLRWKFFWLRRVMTEQLRPAANAIFVGLHPGCGVRFTEGFPNWDFGFVTLDGDWLCYRGEKTRFAMSRQEIHEIKGVTGTIGWFRERRVELSWEGGAFTFSADIAGSRNLRNGSAIKLLRAWMSHEGTAGPKTNSAEPGPCLPSLPDAETTRLREALRICDTALKILVAASVAAMVAWRWIPANIVLLAPLAGVARMLPQAVWPTRTSSPKC
jgi:heat shock protein HtpX